jgi:hypothetical protein
VAKWQRKKNASLTPERPRVHRTTEFYWFLMADLEAAPEIETPKTFTVNILQTDSLVHLYLAQRLRCRHKRKMTQNLMRTNPEIKAQKDEASDEYSPNIRRNQHAPA